jgi:CheY-like chemotaxis protein
MDTADILRQAGFEVAEASNADEALKKLNGGGYRLGALVTDVQMPAPWTDLGLRSMSTAAFPGRLL